MNLWSADVVPAHAEKVNYKIPGFLAKFLELQKVMWTTNSKLTDRHVYDSRPWSWPILRRGIVSIIQSIIQPNLTCACIELLGQRT